MKKLHNAFIFALLLAAVLVSCGKDGTSESNGVTGASWKSPEVNSASGAENTYFFMAAGNWTVSSDHPDWCKVTPASGSAGKAQFTVKTDPNTTGSIRMAAITVSVGGHSSPARFTVSQLGDGSGGSGADTELNRMVDEFLVNYYLWNSDYRKLDRDLSLDYVSSQKNFLKTTLLGMTTNTLDKKPTGNGSYRVYSYLIRTATSGTVSQVTREGIAHNLKPEKTWSFGIASTTIATYKSSGQTYYMFAVSAVYPGSPADAAGIKRGSLIEKVDGTRIDVTNYESFYSSLLSPTGAQSMKLTVYDSAQPVQLTAQQLYPSPVIHEQIIEQGGNKIGYLVYHSFDAAYDDDLLAAIKRFKDAGITDLVLDLRNNGGGHVVSSNLLSTCIAGSRCNGKVFEYYRYNDERMANPTETGRDVQHDYDKELKLFYENFAYGSYNEYDLRQYALELPRLYVLTTGSTASSSEAVINSLRGIGVSVKLVGERTEGKNVGMEVRRLTAGNYIYELAPISFQGYNAARNTVDPSGIPADFGVSNWNNGYVDFGEQDEPLLARALTEITGKTYPVSKTRAEAFDVVPATNIVLPEIPGRPNGMLTLPSEEQEAQ